MAEQTNEGETNENETVAQEATVEGTQTEPAAERTERAERSERATSPAPTKEAGRRTNRRKAREGIVVSDAMNATIVVAVIERVRHPRYGKTVQRTKKLYVHDAENSAKVGDRVRVQETRPISKLKHWRITEVVERAR